MPSPHLHPMSPDSLRPRPAPQAAAFGTPVQLTAPVQRTAAPSLPQATVCIGQQKRGTAQQSRV